MRSPNDPAACPAVGCCVRSKGSPTRTQDGETQAVSIGKIVDRTNTTTAAHRTVVLVAKYYFRVVLDDCYTAACTTRALKKFELKLTTIS
mmetsp:Transcript_15023/g.34405  ORF Transcript_15023/g.34405 Transcript_15023/m.34405 type:complete len:90 (-) Transcript_15023:27-296(-)